MGNDDFIVHCTFILHLFLLYRVPGVGFKNCYFYQINNEKNTVCQDILTVVREVCRVVQVLQTVETELLGSLRCCTTTDEQDTLESVMRQLVLCGNKNQS